jgi:acyl-homoserine-lactone acylase
LAYSESEDPKSPHYNDQSGVFANERFKDAWFYEDDLATHIERMYRP